MASRDEWGHRWNGWPGAMCFYCGSEDPREICLADCCPFCDDTIQAAPYEQCPTHPMFTCPATDFDKDKIDKKLDH